MRKIDLSSIGLSTAGFRDGIGERLVGFDRAAGETLEMLRVRPELATLEAVLVARVGNLAGFKNSRFLGLRGVAKNCSRTFIVSSHVESERLSEILARAQTQGLTPGIGLTLFVVREILQALATLERSHKTAHGAVGPERILVTPRGRIVLAEHMLAPALQRLAFSPAFLWRELRIAMPAKPAPPRFDARADIAQVAMLMLALAAGRPLRQDEFPDRVKALAGDLREALAEWGGTDFADPMGSWLDAALPVQRRLGGFASTAEAQLKFEHALSKMAGSIGSAQALVAFIARLDAPDDATPSSAPEPAAELAPSPTVEFALELTQPDPSAPETPTGSDAETRAPLLPGVEAETTAEVTALLDELFDQAEALCRTSLDEALESEPVVLEAPPVEGSPITPEVTAVAPATDVVPIEPTAPPPLADQSRFEEASTFDAITEPTDPVRAADEGSAIEAAPPTEPPPAAFQVFDEAPAIAEAEAVGEEALTGGTPVAAEPEPTVETPAMAETRVVVRAEPASEEWPVTRTAPPVADEPVVERLPADVVTSRSVFDFTVPPPAPPPAEPPQDLAVAAPPPAPAPPSPPATSAAPPSSTRSRLISDLDESKIPEWMINPDQAAASPPPPAAPEQPPERSGSPWRETVVSPIRSALEHVEAPARTDDDPLERARRILQAEQRKREAAEALEALEAERIAEEEARIQARRRMVRIAAAVLVAALCTGGGYFGWRWWKARTAPGTLAVESQPPGSEVFIDGQARAKTPASITLSPGRHSLELRLGGRSSTFDLRVPPGGTVTQTIDWSKQIDTGSLKVTSEPDGARVSVDGEVRGKTPLDLSEVPAGRHTVVVSTTRGTVTEQVTVQRDEVATVHAAVYSGWLAVFAPVELQIYERAQLIGTTSDGRIMVTPGRHQVDLVNEELGYRATETFTVRPGEVSSISIEPKGQVSVNAIPWAEVFVDGERIGETPIANAAVMVGVREFVFRHPDYGEQRVTATVTMKETTRINVDMTKQ